MSNTVQHEPANSSIVTSIVYSSVKQWVIILTLIFGGCCSNALALEYTASHNPHAGSLITFTQFLLVAIVGLRHRLYVAPFQPRDWNSLVDEIARALLRERKSRTGGEHTKVGIQSQSQELGETLNRDVAECIRTLSPATVVRASQSAFTRNGTFDQEALVTGLLDPLAPGGSQRYVTRVYDRDAGPRVLPTATRKSILLFDGQSIESARLASYWDFCIILESGSETPSGSKLTRNSPTDSRPRMVVCHASSGKKPRIEWSNVEMPMPFLVQLFRLRFRPLKIPLSRWIVQVVLFLITSLLNNAAFKYSIPMAVHIIFRSGGLVVNLLLGLALGKKYTSAQILSVILVTAGVALSTASSLSHKRPKQPNGDFHTTSFTQDHLIGLSLLTLALVLSSLMGLAQERTYAKFGQHWQEGMFYLHFLALPMFAFPGIGGDLVQQIKIANASPPVTIAGHVQNLVGSPMFRPAGPLGAPAVGFVNQTLERIMAFPLFSITLPSFYIPLAVNVFTQFLCVGGVHRLTSQVSSLTVTLVLVVRKAVSLWISVVLVGGNHGDVWLWGGAMAVVVGTVLYSLDSRRPEKIKEKEL